MEQASPMADNQIESKCECIFNASHTPKQKVSIAIENGCISCVGKYNNAPLQLYVPAYSIYELLDSNKPKHIKFHTILKFFKDRLHSLWVDLYLAYLTPITSVELLIALSFHYVPDYPCFGTQIAYIYTPKNIPELVKIKSILLKYRLDCSRKNIKTFNGHKIKKHLQELRRLINEYLTMRRNLFILRSANKLNADTAEYIEQFISL